MLGPKRLSAVAWITVGIALGTTWAWVPRVAEAVTASASTIYDKTGTNAAAVNAHGQLKAIVSTQTTAPLATTDTNGPSLGDIHYKVVSLNAAGSCGQLIASSENAVIRSVVFSVDTTAIGNVVQVERGTCGATLQPLFTWINDKAVVASDELSYNPGVAIPKASTGVLGGLVVVDTPGIPLQVQVTYFTTKAPLTPPGN